MKIFDIHAHIYPDPIAERAVRAISESYDGFEVRGDGRLDTLLFQMNAAGITAFAAHSAAVSASRVDSVNRFIMESAQKHPEAIVPFGSLHPDMPDPHAAVDQMLKLGFRGVKLHPELQGYKVDEPRAIELLRAIAGKLPVLLHCGDYRCDHSAPERIKRMLRQVPGLKLVCAHLGGWTTWEVSAAELSGENIWVDTSSSLYELDASTAVSLIRSYGTDRVLFGTDFPVWTPKEEVERFLRLPLNSEEQERILWSNHLRLLET